MVQRPRGGSCTLTEQRILRSIRRHLKASYTALRVTGEAGEDGYWEVHRQVKRNRLKTGDSPVGERFMVTRNGDLNPADLPRWAKLSRARGRGGSDWKTPTTCVATAVRLHGTRWPRRKPVPSTTRR